MPILISVLLIALWLAVLITDLRARLIPILVLLSLAVLALLGQTWPWWLLIAIALAWPLAQRPTAIMLAPVAIGVGVVTGVQAPGVALAVGVTAWALNWWGGADAIVLVALGLRYGWPGLIAGAAASVVVALSLMLIRRRRLIGVVPVLSEAVLLQPRTVEPIAAEAELPAAAVMAVAGLVLELIQLIH